MSETSSEADIKKAYKKLSIKFHPDKNPNDEFFEQRFKDILEAYETLSNETKRGAYNFERRRNASGSHSKSNESIKPTIKIFSVNKDEVRSTDEIVIKWQVENADSVVLYIENDAEKVLGQGERILRLPQIEQIGASNLKLKAVNLIYSTSIEKRLIVKSKSYADQQRHEQMLNKLISCLLYTSPSPRDRTRSRMPSSA